jgi:hypothetical protein
VEQWKPVPAIPANQKAAFDFKVREQGQNVKLHRLGEPAAVEVSFRSRKLSWFYESVAFLLVVIAGIGWLRKSLPRKVLAAAVVGLAALVATGLLGAVNGAIAQAVMLGVLTVVALWLAAAAPKGWGAMAGLRLRHRIFGLLVLGELLLLTLAVVLRAGEMAGVLFFFLVITVAVWAVVAIVAAVRGSQVRLTAPAPAPVPASASAATAAPPPLDATGAVPALPDDGDQKTK